MIAARVRVLRFLRNSTAFFFLFSKFIQSKSVQDNGSSRLTQPKALTIQEHFSRAARMWFIRSTPQFQCWRGTTEQLIGHPEDFPLHFLTPLVLEGTTIKNSILNLSLTRVTSRKTLRCRSTYSINCNDTCREDHWVLVLRTTA